MSTQAVFERCERLIALPGFDRSEILRRWADASGVPKELPRTAIEKWRVKLQKVVKLRKVQLRTLVATSLIMIAAFLENLVFGTDLLLFFVSLITAGLILAFFVYVSVERLEKNQFMPHARDVTEFIVWVDQACSLLLLNEDGVIQIQSQTAFDELATTTIRSHMWSRLALEDEYAKMFCGARLISIEQMGNLVDRARSAKQEALNAYNASIVLGVKHGMDYGSLWRSVKDKMDAEAAEQSDAKK